MPRSSAIVVAILAASLALPRISGAWGSGHDDVMRAVIERLPEDLRAVFTPERTRLAVEKHSHYPDSFEPFLPADVGESAIAALLDAGVKVRYDLHHDHGRVAGFARLVEALREGNPDHIALWIAAHSHVVADMAACNHDPLVHTATYGWGPWKVKLPNRGDFSQVAPLLDLSGSARDPAGGAEAFARAIDRLALPDDGRDVPRQILDILLYGQEGARFCSSRGVKILHGAATSIDSGDPKDRALLWENIGELGAWAVVRTLRDIAVAQRLAKTDSPIELTPAIETAAQEAVATLLRDRSLAEDALYAPILRELPAKPEPGVVGVVLEPTWDMNDAMLGFSSRVQSTATVRTLAQLGRPHATLDVRRLITDGFPAPDRVPLLIIVATSFRNYHWLSAETFDAGLAGYVADGGRVLWVAGTGVLPKSTFRPFAAALTRTEKATLPVPTERFLKATLRTHLPGESEWAMANSPDTPAGWQKPLCPWVFKPTNDAPLVPLITLDTGSETHLVGAMTPDRRLAILPIYAVTPFLLRGDDRCPSPAEPALDGPAAAILTGAIDRLLVP